jgi:hypothetical protein
MSGKSFRYQFPKKAIKSDCPNCSPNHHKTLSRYVDAQTGDTLPEQFGRCDRETNCGYHLSPYTKDASDNSYASEVNGIGQLSREWFKIAARAKRNHVQRESTVHTLMNMGGATPEQAEQVVNYIFKKQPDEVVHSLPTQIHTIPDEIFNKSLGHYEHNQFARLLSAHLGESAANELLKRFYIGTSARWPGGCVFWLIDEKGRKRGGQIKLFDDQWHTVKYVSAKGEKRSRTSWVHSALKSQLDREGKTLPDWLIEYEEKAERSPCFFGLPQLLTESVKKPIAIVEAPKTAVLCTHYNKKFIWLAAVGRSYLTVERLAPLKGRNIVLFPDVSIDGRDYAYWKGKADSFRQQGFNVIISDQLERVATNEQREKGYDLADFLLMPFPRVVKHLADWKPGAILRPDESQLERLDVNLVDTYPIEWG